MIALPVATLLDMRSQGATYQELVEWCRANGHRTSLAGLHRLLSDHGAPRVYRQRPDGKPNPPASEHVRWAIRWRDGETCASIARTAGVTRQAVHAAIRKLLTSHGLSTTTS